METPSTSLPDSAPSAPPSAGTPDSALVSTDQVVALPQEPPMDIHRPKPVHNLREFLGEIAIIVIGVLIALGLEQAVEAWHWHEEVAAERAALKAEELDGRTLVLLRQQLQPCVDRRLAEVRILLQRHHDRQPLGIIGPIDRPDGSGITLGSWQMALAGQGLAHMPLREKLALSEHFSSYQKYNMVIDEEQRLWTKLAVVDDAALLSDANWSDLSDTFAEAKAVNNRLRRNVPLFLAFMPKDTSGQAARPDNAQEMSICRPMLAQTAAANGDG